VLSQPDAVHFGVIGAANRGGGLDANDVRPSNLGDPRRRRLRCLLARGALR